MSSGLTGERANELKTERLTLRRARPDDAEALHVLFTDEETMECWSTPVHQNMDQTEDWLASMIDAPEDHSDDFIVEKDGELIGKCGLWRVPEIGFMIRRDHWGQGLATEALDAFISYISGRGLPYMFADVDPANPGSLRALEKVGFSRSGYKEKAMQHGERWVDSVYLRRDL
ncbi:GNAT family N-acetyltransferase [Sphingomicrobium sediminis]|uniref:GNAT family N-acetyltransferase n=1 Tax=Sphingomicrobium sediminis TaxID=2950949 RepID=UPI003CC6A9B2